MKKFSRPAASSAANHHASLFEPLLGQQPSSVLNVKGKRYFTSTLLLLLLLAFSASIFASPIYKYKDRHGRIHYSETRPPIELGYERLGENCFYNSSSCDRDKFKGLPWSSEPLNHSSFALFIKQVAREKQVDSALLRAVIHVESGFNPYAISKKGARGLMQLMPPLLQQYEVSRPFDYRQNIYAGAQHLSYLLKRYNQNIALATAAYNAGEGAVNKYQTIPPYKETQNYVRKVHFLFKRYRMAKHH